MLIFLYEKNKWTVYYKEITISLIYIDKSPKMKIQINYLDIK